SSHRRHVHDPAPAREPRQDGLAPAPGRSTGITPQEAPAKGVAGSSGQAPSRSSHVPSNPAWQSVGRMALETESPRYSTKGHPNSRRHAVGAAQLSGQSPALEIELQPASSGSGKTAEGRMVCQHGDSAVVPEQQASSRGLQVPGSVVVVVVVATVVL